MQYLTNYIHHRVRLLSHLVAVPAREDQLISVYQSTEPGKAISCREFLSPSSHLYCRERGGEGIKIDRDEWIDRGEAGRGLRGGMSR